MKREIKFRAWDKTFKRLFCIFDSNTQTEWFIPNMKGGNYEYMQFTGLHDKNGVDVYESDIVSGNFPYATKGIVTWDEKRCGFYIAPTNGLGKAAYDKGYKMNAAKIEVIGNIHENPELLS